MPKAGHDDIEPTEGERIDAMEFVARVLVQIPDPRRHLVRYYGAYSNATRGKRKKAAASAEPSSPDQAPEDAAIPDGPYRAALRRRWAELIRRVYEVDPLICPRCGSEMRVIGFITQPALIDRILDHLRKARQDPSPASALVAASGHPRLRSAPRAAVRPRGKADVSARDPCPSLHEALGAHLTHGRGASWPSQPPSSPRHEAQPGCPDVRRGPWRARPEKEVPIPHEEGQDPTWRLAPRCDVAVPTTVRRTRTR